MVHNTNKKQKNYEMIVVPYSVEDVVSVEKDSFKKFFDEKLHEYNEDNGKELKPQDIGNILGITGIDVFRKKLNHEKHSTKRDLIIAIAITLELNLADTNTALHLYNYEGAKNYVQMLPLTQDDARDCFIISQLDYKNYPTVKELNHRLRCNNFLELDIHDSRKNNRSNSVSSSQSKKYTKIECQVRKPILNDFYYSDIYNSLSADYDPYNYRCFGDMIIKNNITGRYIQLTVDNHNYLSSRILGKKDEPYNSYRSINETGDYEPFFVELSASISLEHRKYLDVLNDTKNYKMRRSADLRNDTMVIYAEEFNYAIPEMQEYFVVVRKKSSYQLYIYDQSAFMYYYLPDEQYRELYSKTPPTPVESYASIEDLEKTLTQANDDNASIKLRIYKRAFIRLTEYVDNLLEDIRNRKQSPLNAEAIFDCPAEVLAIYNLEKNFGCKYNEYDDICGCEKTECDFALPDGTSISITLDDILRAYELGFEGIEDICRIKATQGSVDAILY